MHLLKRSIGALAIGLLLVTALAMTPAHAAPSQADDCDDNYSDVNIITITPSSPDQGEEVTIAGEGFEPGVGVDLTLETDPPNGSPIDLATVVTGELDTPEAGTFEITVTLDYPEGAYTITAVSDTCADDRGSVDFVLGQEIVAPPAPSPSPAPPADTPTTGNLARTGGGRTITLTQVAIALVALGGVLLMTGGRRRVLRRPSHST